VLYNSFVKQIIDDIVRGCEIYDPNTEAINVHMQSRHALDQYYTSAVYIGFTLQHMKWVAFLVMIIYAVLNPKLNATS